MSRFHHAPTPTRAKRLLLPNGHRTSSDKICRIVVDADRSQPPDLAYVAVSETSGLVFEGLVELNGLEELGRGDWAEQRPAHGGEEQSQMETSNGDSNLWRR